MIKFSILPPVLSSFLKNAELHFYCYKLNFNKLVHEMTTATPEPMNPELFLKQAQNGFRPLNAI